MKKNPAKETRKWPLSKRKTNRLYVSVKPVEKYCFNRIEYCWEVE